MMIRQAALLVTAMSLSCAMVGCTQPTEPPRLPDATVIKGAGATFPWPLYEKWIEEYQASHPKVIIEYEAAGSGGGIAAFLEESVDFGASDAAMTDEQMAQVERGVQLVPVAAGSIAIVYNLGDFSGDLRLPRDVYVDIFMGRITDWDDPRIRKANPNVELPDLAIAVVARQDGSGTTYAFTNHLSVISQEWAAGPSVGKEIDWPAGAMLSFGNEGVAALVKRTPGAIGYVEYGLAQRTGLAMARLENKAGSFVQPSADAGLETLVNAKLPENFRLFFPDPDGRGSYPIVTYTWLLLYKNYPDDRLRSELKSFVKWCLTDGQQFSESLGYIRVAPDVASDAASAVQQIH